MEQTKLTWVFHTILQKKARYLNISEAKRPMVVSNMQTETSSAEQITYTETEKNVKSIWSAPITLKDLISILKRLNSFSKNFKVHNIQILYHIYKLLSFTCTVVE